MKLPTEFPELDAVREKTGAALSSWPNGQRTATSAAPRYRVVTVDARFRSVLEPAHTDDLDDALAEARARAARHPQRRTSVIANGPRSAVLFDSARA